MLTCLASYNIHRLINTLFQLPCICFLCHENQVVNMHRQVCCALCRTQPAHSAAKRHATLLADLQVECERPEVFFELV